MLSVDRRSNRHAGIAISFSSCVRIFVYGDTELEHLRGHGFSCGNLHELSCKLHGYWARTFGDGVASVLIGLTMAGGGVLLTYESKKLLVGESVDSESVARIRSIVEADPSVTITSLASCILQSCSLEIVPLARVKRWSIAPPIAKCKP
jgi:hypothetical protein